MIKDQRHSCNPRAAIRLGEPGGVFSLGAAASWEASFIRPYFGKCQELIANVEIFLAISFTL
jgi:hypothetical protein